MLQLGLPKLLPAPYSVKDAYKVTPVAAAAAVDVEALVKAAATVVEALIEQRQQSWKPWWRQRRQLYF